MINRSRFVIRALKDFMKVAIVSRPLLGAAGAYAQGPAPLLNGSDAARPCERASKPSVAKKYNLDK